jgi:hypothetical protein
MKSTVRWSNFERRDPKTGVFLKSTEATPCGYFFEWKLTPENTLWTPCPWPPWPWFPVKNRWRFSKFCTKKKKKRNHESHFKNLDLAGKWVWRVQCSLVWKLVFRVTYSVLKQFWSNHLLEHIEAMNEPQNVQMTLNGLSFVSKFKGLFVCLPEDVWHSNFRKCLKMPQG